MQNRTEMLQKIMENPKDREDLVRMLSNEAGPQAVDEIVLTIFTTRAAQDRREIVLKDKPRGIFTDNP